MTSASCNRSSENHLNLQTRAVVSQTNAASVKMILPQTDSCFPVQVRGLPGQEVVVGETFWSGGLRGADPCSQNHHRQVERLRHRQCDHGDASPVLCILRSLTWHFNNCTQLISFVFELSDQPMDINCCTFCFYWILLLSYSVFYVLKCCCCLLRW